MSSDSNEQTGCAGCSRREFLSSSVLGAVGAMLVASCGDGVFGGSSLTGPTTTVNTTVLLSDYPALATVGGVARITSVATPIVVVRTAASTYLALSLICPHAGTTVNLTGNQFVCPNHRATFNSTGTWTGGQRTSNLQSLTVALNATASTLTITGTTSVGGGGDDDG